MSNQPNNQQIPLDINTLNFDSFGRDARRDVVCLAPIRTVIRREEEIVLVRKVRKVEEIDAGLSCPATTETLSSGFSSQAVTPIPIYQPANPTSEDTSPAEPAEPVRQQPSIREDLVVHSRWNCYHFDPESMRRLQEETAVSKLLQPGTYTITLERGTFDYRAAYGHPGEPLVLLWLYGGQVTNRRTGIPVNATWSSLNGYGDSLIIDVVKPTTLCGFFFDTYLDDNEGEVTVTVSGADYEEYLVVHSQRNCYYIDPVSMRQIEEVAVSRQLPVGSYAIQFKTGTFGYQAESGHQGEPIVMLWIYGGKVINHDTDVEVGATWVSLNGYGDTLMLDVLEPATLCAFFFDTYIEDNQGEVVLFLENC